MKRFLMICLSVLVLAGTLPSVPVQAQSVAIPMDYDLALEIYYTLLCLLETGRIASGYDHSIFGDNFYDNIDEYNAWLAEYYPEVKGITYHHAGGADSLEDWVNKPWSKDGNVISGALSYKLSVLRNDNNLGNFNNNMQDPNDHENDTFDLLHWVNIAASAGVAANGIFANIKNFFSAVENGDVELPDFKYNGFSGYDYDQNGNIIINGMCMDPGGSMYYGFEQKIFGSGYYYYFCADSGYFYSYRANTQVVGGSRYTITCSYEIVNGNRYDGNYAVVNCAYPTNYRLNIPVFLSDGQAMSYFNGTGGMPLNFNRFNNGYLIQALSNSFMPLIDTNITSVGFIGMLGALREVLNRVGQNSDPNDNAEELAEEVPDTLDEILPDYDPEPDPDPDPDPIPEPEPEPVPPPIPDPDPDPEPEPEPDPEPDPEIDPVPDPDPDPNLETIPIISGLENRFPFCIPWDLKALFQNLSAEREAPSWTYHFYISPEWLPPRGFQYDFELDLSGMEWLASLFRRLFLVSFVIGLAIYSYGKFFGGGD